MPLYIGDFLRDTTGLDTEMIAEYILLYVAIWTKAGPLPDDNERLARICRMTTERFIETREELSSLFDVRDGGWSHDDLLAERAKWVETRRKKKAAGRVGGNAMWAKRKKSETNPPGFPEDA